MEQPLGVFEPIDRRHRETKFAVLGVPVSFTRGAMLSWPMMLLPALPIAWWEKRGDGRGAILARAAQLATIFLSSNVVHSLGHILGGKLVDQPMDELIITATRQVNRYEGEQEHLPPTTHLARAAGGATANGLVGLVAGGLWLALGGQHALLRHLATSNVGSALLALLPVDSVDGKEILKRVRQLSGDEGVTRDG